jgi:hypothetical protein
MYRVNHIWWIVRTDNRGRVVQAHESAVAAAAAAAAAAGAAAVVAVAASGTRFLRKETFSTDTFSIPLASVLSW